MNLICYFDERAGGNPAFIQLFKSLYDGLITNYPEHTFTHHPARPNDDFLPYISNFIIINPDNNRTILMSLWDRGMDVLYDRSIWPKYPIVQYIGGIGMHMNSEQIRQTFGIDHIPYQYPLGVPNAYEYINELKSDYDPQKKLRKAVFMGSLYGMRQRLKEMTAEHPLIDVFGNNDPYHGKEYFKKLNEYKIAISINGNGEICMRDFEAMGMKIPVVRSELITQFYNPLTPGVHYIRATDPVDEAINMNCDYDKICREFITTVENVIDNDELLQRISERGSQYFRNYCGVDYMTKLYFDIINVKKLE